MRDDSDDGPRQRLLTPAELPLMTVLWDHGPGTVRDVMAHLPPDPAYTTVSTILRILEQKGFVTSRKRGRTHVYEARVPRARYESRNVRELVGSLFGGDAAAMARRLVEQESLTRDDLRELLQVVEQRLDR